MYFERCLYEDEEMGLLIGSEMRQGTGLEGLYQMCNKMAGKPVLVSPGGCE